MPPDDSIPVSDLARRTRAVVERLAREPRRRLVVMKNNRAVAVISGVEAQPEAAGGLRAELERKKRMIGAIARAHGARAVHLFGSAARGEEGPDSDVDLLVELEPGRSLLDLIGLENDLSDALGRKVDVLTARGAKPRVLKAALRDAVRLV
ncbi:MAG: nucleotidyltransferase family protein [Burkholderiales bacterium]|nr:nucleotidyltransferase family protein [Burkholderiales bacterium]